MQRIKINLSYKEITFDGTKKDPVVKKKLFNPKEEGGNNERNNQIEISRKFTNGKNLFIIFSKTSEGNAIVLKY